ncbi:acyltransferase [Endozoicomonas sp. SM1973]|uniref:Acyltransferase n=1 Tax=Spartinivicinus marinus TaxID=2994442 RepID=A0A853I4F5_9GAMM|nr:acyltransferase [Spartinivicinus marinus]MCX4028263.1 acyltransferase [Spartinivicinus marinus]NYZ65598.1 acyltransferase [Spartinivicinus marinus]
MLKKLPPPIKGCIACLMLALNTIILSCPLLIIALLKLLIPIKAWQQACAKILIKIAELWMCINSLWMKLTQQLKLDVKGLSSLKKDGWYLVTSNHQSWADITLLQHILNRRIPMLKFFIKQELIWIPVIGLCWWALDFPFMKRYSKAYLEKHPEKKGQDLATTRKACEKFKETPVAVFNFIEGTRFTDEKHRAQQSPFNHLLKPKAGGIGFVLGAMGDQLKSLLDITIYYPEKQLSYWDFLCGKINDVAIRIEKIEIPKELLNKDYINDGQFREQFQLWVTELWEKKDQLLGELSKQKTVVS